MANVKLAVPGLRVLVVAGLLLARPALTSASADPSLRAEPMVRNPSATYNELIGVAAVTASNAWAVGDFVNNGSGADDTLILHWNGSAWSRVASPNPSSTVNLLNGIRAVSATNIWAVGYFTDDGTGADRTLILHWNGSKWSQAASPNPSSSTNRLYAVNGGGSQGGAWAVGTYVEDGTGTRKALTLHREGTTWTWVDGANPSSTHNDLRAVRTPGPANAWAVGIEYDDTAGVPFTLAEHWNGSAWTQVVTPNPSSVDNELYGLSGTTPSNAWAVGLYADSAVRTLILHWDGHAWTKKGSPNPSSTSNYLAAVRAVSATNAWAVGSFRDDTTGNVRTLIEHWNGHVWAKVGSPSVGTADSLQAVAATSPSGAWAVGSYVHGVIRDTLILHWNGTTWVVR
jgi:hypothetical protein